MVSEPWIAQEALEGQEICAYAVACAGRLSSLSMYTCDYRAGKGAGVFFAPIEDQNIRDFVDVFVASSNWEGQISFDSIRLTDGRVMPLECNPRATSGVHFFGNGAAFAQMMLHGTSIEPDIKRPQTLPLAMWI